MPSYTDQHSFIDIRGMVARTLLEHANGGTGGQSRLAQRDIAATVGADWGMVHISLKSLQEQGAIRIERNRLYVNKELLQKMAAADEQ